MFRQGRILRKIQITLFSKGKREKLVRTLDYKFEEYYIEDIDGIIITECSDTRFVVIFRCLHCFKSITRKTNS